MYAEELRQYERELIDYDKDPDLFHGPKPLAPRSIASRRKSGRPYERPSKNDVLISAGQLLGILESKIPIDPIVSGLAGASRYVLQKVKDAVWRRDEGKCVQCGSNENLEFDHIIPFSKGGSNTARNIQLLCEKCNGEKSDKIG